MSDKSGWALVWKINGDFLRAALGLGFGYGFWLLRISEGHELYGYVAVLCACVGAVRAAAALGGVIRLILGFGKWSRYQKKGAAPKADRMAGDSDLNAGGLFK